MAQWFPDTTAATNSTNVRTVIDQKTKPPGSLGQIELVAAQLALLQNTVTPVIGNGRVIVFGADHGISDEGVSAYPSEVTAQMMANFAGGGAAVCVFAAANAMDVEVVDVGVKSELGHLASIVQAKVAPGTNNFATIPAMDRDQRLSALDVGRQSIDRACEQHVHCVGLGEMGIANTTSASAIVALLLNMSAQDVTGRGTGVGDAALSHKCTVIQNAIDLHRSSCTDAMRVLEHVGGFEIAAMVGAMLAANERQLPVLVDGFISSAAALIAVHHDPSVRRCLFFSHHSAELGHTAILESLNAYPLLRLDMRLGEGSATALAYPLLRAASAMMTNMSTFAQAGVTDKS